MSNCIYVGDEGTIFRVQMTNCVTGSIIDISTATTKEIVFEKPTGVVVRQTATFTTDGTDGMLEYAVVTGDLDMSGTWSIQGYVERPGYKNSSSVSTFSVLDILA